MENGHVVIERLKTIEASLERSLILVKNELDRRSEYTEYTGIYLCTLTDLQTKTSQMEDQIRRAL